MPKVRLLAAATDPKTGEPVAPGATLEVDDETFADWRSRGLASSVEDEEKAVEAASEGNFSARVTREDVASTKSEETATQQ